MRVMVVDDDSGVRNLIDQCLRHRGFDVAVVGNGEEAVELYAEDPKRFQIILLDVQMPGMNGPQTLEALKAVDPQVCVVFMSGNTGRYSHEELLSLGAVQVILKPFLSISAVAKMLEEAMTKCQTST